MQLFQKSQTKSQKQPPTGCLKKRCSENLANAENAENLEIQQISRRTPMLKCDFEIVLRHGRSPVNFQHIFRTPFVKTPLDGCFWEVVVNNSARAKQYNYCRSSRRLYKWTTAFQSIYKPTSIIYPIYALDENNLSITGSNMKDLKKKYCLQWMVFW